MSYVLETSAAINLERANRLIKLEYPGDWLIVPSGVAMELNPDFKGTPESTKKWLNKGKIAHSTELEESLYRKLILNPAVDDGEAQAIAIAHYRKAVLIIDEKKNGEVWRVAESYNIECITSEEFINKIFPHLPGF